MTEKEMLTKPRHGHIDMAMRVDEKYREGMIDEYHANMKQALRDQAKVGLLSDEM